MKNFNSLNQNEDSSGNQWELSPEELAEIKKEQSRRELSARVKEIEGSDEYRRAVENSDSKNYRMHEKVNESKTSEERLKDYYLRHDSQRYDKYAAEEIQARKDVESVERLYEAIKKSNYNVIAKAMRTKESEQYHKRGGVKKFVDWVRCGFSSKRVEKKYFEGSSAFIKEHNISVGDDDFRIAYSPSYDKADEAIADAEIDLAINEDLRGTDSSLRKLYNLDMDWARNGMKEEKHRAMIEGYNNDRGNPSAYARVNARVNSIAITKSIRRNEKKKQKQK